MKKVINKISKKLSITETEIRTIIFVILIFGFGSFVKYNNLNFSVKSEQNFNYHFHDSLFYALAKKKGNLLIPLKKVEKRVDSELELLDFSNKKLDQKKKSSTNVKKNSININTASIEILTSLPGIGPKTAKKIIVLRIKKNGYKNLDELIEVKGIGIKKLVRIKEFLIKIEK